MTIDPLEAFAAALVDFGVTAEINGGTVAGLFTPRGAVRLEADGPVEIEQPFLQVRTADLADLDLEVIAGPDGDPLTIDGAEYVVLSVHADGEGISMVTLREVD